MLIAFVPEPMAPVLQLKLFLLSQSLFYVKVQQCQILVFLKTLCVFSLKGSINNEVSEHVLYVNSNMLRAKFGVSITQLYHLFFEGGGEEVGHFQRTFCHASPAVSKIFWAFRTQNAYLFLL